MGHRLGSDAPYGAGGGDEELGVIPCVLIPSGLTDQPLSSLHEEVRSRAAQITSTPTIRPNDAFLWWIVEVQTDLTKPAVPTFISRGSIMILPTVLNRYGSAA
ncbi:MAG: hypothetical protein JOY96_10260 [Verrucomicrobia bacterium]|nr:hypothetical protein [Verrucomicrobiota bacterium]MBV9671750.1 hypothetical protein [Verrucomicrobiota bacterium]